MSRRWCKRVWFIDSLCRLCFLSAICGGSSECINATSMALNDALPYTGGSAAVVYRTCGGSVVSTYHDLRVWTGMNGDKLFSRSKRC